MNQDMSYATAVLETLLKTNRPATDQERATILESMAPTNAKLKMVEGQISDTMDHIEALKLQVKQAEIKLQRLRDEKVAILETFADHRRVFSPFRKLPEDVLREISIACVQGSGIPQLSYSIYAHTPMPYLLGQICRGLRRVAWTTPCIWASMDVRISSEYANSTQRAIEWLGRSGGLALTLIIEFHAGNDSNHYSALFDVLLDYSTRWKEIKFASYSPNLPIPMIRIASLKAADLPLLQSVSLNFHRLNRNIVLRDSELLRIPKLRHVSLNNDSRMFTVNWAILTSLTLRGNTTRQILRIFQKTPCLEFCDIDVPFSTELYAHEINLPHLKTLHVTQDTRDASSSGAHSILHAITAPVLETLETWITFFDLSMPDFLKKSPYIRELYFWYFNRDESKSLTETMKILIHCPSLTILTIRDYDRIWDIPDVDQFLLAFVEAGDYGIICPRLHQFTLTGRIMFSLASLQIFLEGKQGNIPTPNVMPWKKVFISKYDTKYVEEDQQIRDLVSRKQDEGLDVHVHV